MRRQREGAVVISGNAFAVQRRAMVERHRHGDAVVAVLEQAVRVGERQRQRAAAILVDGRSRSGHHRLIRNRVHRSSRDRLVIDISAGVGKREGDPEGVSLILFAWNVIGAGDTGAGSVDPLFLVGIENLPLIGGIRNRFAAIGNQGSNGAAFGSIAVRVEPRRNRAGDLGHVGPVLG